MTVRVAPAPVDAPAFPRHSRRCRHSWNAEAALLNLVRIDTGPMPRIPVSEWDRVALLARREQVSPLVWAAVQERGCESVPPSARTALERASVRSASHAANAYRQLTVTLHLLRNAGVTVVLIKGAALARFVYADRGSRPFHDLDLLIPPHHCNVAHRALREAGYATASADNDRVLHTPGERVYWDPTWRRVPIDLHWRLDTAPLYLGLDCTPMLRRARVEVVGAEPVQVLSPADWIVALAAHFVKHWWWGQPRLRYLRDVAEIARRYRVDWDVVAQTARAAPAARSPLRFTLSAASELMGASVPGAVLDALAPHRGARVDRYLRQRTRRRILKCRDWPLAVLLQVAAMRWLDRDSVSIYPCLAAWVLRSRARRVLASLRRSGRTTDGGGL
jgi:hypothetical protein